jgi:hypothetical protein
MNKRHVTAALNWLRQQDGGALSELTAFDLFVAAFVPYEEVDQISRSRIESDFQDFDTYGFVPTYVSRFLCELIFPFFLVHSASPPHGEVTCFLPDMQHW